MLMLSKVEKLVTKTLTFINLNMVLKIRLNDTLDLRYCCEERLLWIFCFIY